MFCKIDVLKNFAKLTGKTPVQEFFEIFFTEQLQRLKVRYEICTKSRMKTLTQLYIDSSGCLC